MLWDEEDPDLSIPDMNPSCGDIPNIDAGCRQVCRWAALRLTGGEGVKSRQGEGVPLKDGQPLDLQIGPVRNHENKKCSLGRCWRQSGPKNKWGFWEWMEWCMDT